MVGSCWLLGSIVDSRSICLDIVPGIRYPGLARQQGLRCSDVVAIGGVTAGLVRWAQFPRSSGQDLTAFMISNNQIERSAANGAVQI